MYQRLPLVSESAALEFGDTDLTDARQLRVGGLNVDGDEVHVNLRPDYAGATAVASVTAVTVGGPAPCCVDFSSSLRLRVPSPRAFFARAGSTVHNSGTEGTFSFLKTVVRSVCPRFSSASRRARMPGINAQSVA